MWNLRNLNREERLRFENIIDMGLAYSGMIRNFAKGSKEILLKRIVNSTAEKLFNVNSQKEFTTVHSEFCEWGTRNIKLAERKRKGKVIKKSGPASYGQIAKTFDVTLKVAIYYCHLPDCTQSVKLCNWINSAIDTNMMRELRKEFPNEIRKWPTTIEDVDKTTYFEIQKLVRRAIKEWHNGTINPPQYDDIHWRIANK
jgi:hypothetical protein